MNSSRLTDIHAKVCTETSQKRIRLGLFSCVNCPSSKLVPITEFVDYINSSIIIHGVFGCLK